MTASWYFVSLHSVLFHDSLFPTLPLAGHPPPYFPQSRQSWVWFLIVIGNPVVSKECLDDNKNESSSVGISSVRAQSPNVRFSLASRAGKGAQSKLRRPPDHSPRTV